MAAGYVVRQNDTLWSIARAHGMTLARLEQLNPEFSKNFNLIFPGQTVNLIASATHKPGVSPTRPSPIPRPGPVGKPGTPLKTPPPPLDSYTQLLNQLQGMPGQERDAFAALSTLFNSYGLSSLTPKIIQYLKDGFGSDTITTLLQQTPEYKARFAGNELRKKLGLQVLTPAEYLSAEASYRQILRVSGVDPAMMNEKYYADWIGNDVAPTELQDRVNLAVQATVNAPNQLKQGLAQIGVNMNDIVGFFLNKRTPLPQLQLKMNAAQMIQAASQSGLGISNAEALQFAQQGVTYQEAEKGYQQVADVTPRGNQLSQIYKTQAGYGQQEAAQEFLGGSGQAQLAREALSRQEEGTFSGQGGTGQKSFAQQTAGTGF